MRAKIVEYFDYSDDMPLKCPVCGWSGPAKDAPKELHSSPLFDRSCPECWKMLLIVPFPTFEQTRAAAKAGNAEAIRMCREQNIDER